MTTAKVTHSTKSLMGRIESYGKSATKLYADGQAIAVDCLLHIAETRDTRPLSAFHRTLLKVSPNHATALRVWAGKIQREVLDLVPGAYWIGYSSKEQSFTVGDAEKFADVEATALKKAATIGKISVYARDVRGEPDLMDLRSFAQRIHNLLNAADKAGDKRVPKELRQALTNVVTLTDKMREARKSATPAPKPLKPGEKGIRKTASGRVAIAAA